jgi:integrase
MTTLSKAKRKQRLTEFTVRQARPAPGAYAIWDTHQHGLALRVQPTGGKAWVVVYSRHGRSRWLTIGDANAIALADARMLAQETMLAVARGGDPAAEKRAERSGGTFAELADKYVEQHARKYNRSWRQGEHLVRRHALPALGKLPAASITRADIKQMVARIKAPMVANQTLAAVSAVFSWGLRENVITINPCKLVEKNPVRSRERVLSESEVPLFWQALGELEPVTGAALKMILLSGQRPGEVCAMRREHIIDGWWTMPGEPVPGIWPGTKNGQSHRVWIPAPARALIAGDDSPGFVFPAPRGSGPISNLPRAMVTVCTKTGIKPAVRPHDLRRTHGSTITAMGFGRDAMNRIQNHREGGIADVYDRHGYEGEIKTIMESVANKIMVLVEGKDDGKVLPFAR